MHCQVDTNYENLSNNIFDHMPVNVGQTEVAPLVSVGKLTVINAKQM